MFKDGLFGLFGLVLVALGVLLVPSAIEAASLRAPRNCFQELARGQGADIVCEYPASLAQRERDELRRLTRELLQDARCTVAIRVQRSLVAQAMSERDHTFEAPPQPVACEILTSQQPFLIEATFSPRVVIKDCVAVDATPGMANIKGVNSYVAWPVVEYINRSETVRTEMIRMINAYLELRQGTRRALVGCLD